MPRDYPSPAVRATRSPNPDPDRPTPTSTRPSRSTLLAVHACLSADHRTAAPSLSDLIDQALTDELLNLAWTSSSTTAPGTRSRHGYEP